MRKLAIFTGSFSLGIFLSQYLLSAVWLLPCAVGAFLFSCGRLVVPGDWGRRLLLAGVGISLAFGWNWLYMRQVQRPMEALADTEHVLTMTLCVKSEVHFAVSERYLAEAYLVSRQRSEVYVDKTHGVHSLTTCCKSSAYLLDRSAKVTPAAAKK